MVISLQMQGGMDSKMCILESRSFAARRPLLNHRRANHHISIKNIGIAGKRISIVVNKGQHVGGSPAAVTLVQLAALGSSTIRSVIDTSRCNAVYPAAQLRARRRRARGVLHRVTIAVRNLCVFAVHSARRRRRFAPVDGALHPRRESRKHDAAQSFNTLRVSIKPLFCRAPDRLGDVAGNHVLL